MNMDNTQGQSYIRKNEGTASGYSIDCIRGQGSPVQVLVLLLSKGRRLSFRFICTQVRGANITDEKTRELKPLPTAPVSFILQQE
ncbi:hypothetical protein PAMP_002600 [Pampus punctatissimus]